MRQDDAEGQHLLMVSIITITPTSVSTEVRSCVRFCCSVPLMLSRSLTAAHHLAARPRVEELERQTIDLAST